MVCEMAAIFFQGHELKVPPIGYGSCNTPMIQDELYDITVPTEGHADSNHQQGGGLFNSFFRLTSTKTIKRSFTEPLWRESTSDRWTLSQNVNDAENESVSMSWCHRGVSIRSTSTKIDHVITSQHCTSVSKLLKVLMSFVGKLHTKHNGSSWD